MDSGRYESGDACLFVYRSQAGCSGPHVSTRSSTFRRHSGYKRPSYIHIYKHPPYTFSLLLNITTDGSTPTIATADIIPITDHRWTVAVVPNTRLIDAAIVVVAVNIYLEIYKYIIYIRKILYNNVEYASLWFFFFYYY